MDCNEEYIGETSRTFDERFKEHLKAPLDIHGHQSATGHSTILDNLNIVGKEGQDFARKIKESIYIRVNNPTLNRNTGKYNLPHIWGGVHLDVSGLKFKTQTQGEQKQQKQVHRTSLLPHRTSRLYIKSDNNRSLRPYEANL